LAAALPHPNGGDFPDQLAILIKENVKALITRSGKTMVEPKAKSKKMSPIDPVEEEEKAEAEVEVEPRPEKEEESLGKALPNGGMTVIYNEKNKLIHQWTVIGWRMCIDYRKLNKATR
jgi:hypothetical protein